MIAALVCTSGSNTPEACWDFYRRLKFCVPYSTSSLLSEILLIPRSALACVIDNFWSYVVFLYDFWQELSLLTCLHKPLIDTSQHHLISIRSSSAPRRSYPSLKSDIFHQTSHRSHTSDTLSLSLVTCHHHHSTTLLHSSIRLPNTHHKHLLTNISPPAIATSSLGISISIH